MREHSDAHAIIHSQAEVFPQSDSESVYALLDALEGPRVAAVCIDQEGDACSARIRARRRELLEQKRVEVAAGEKAKETREGEGERLSG